MRVRKAASASASISVAGGGALDDVAGRGLREQLAHREPPGQGVEAGERLLGVGHRLGGHLDGRAVAGPEDEQPVGPGIVRRQEIGEAW